jgi:hypothetical protein
MQIVGLRPQSQSTSILFLLSNTISPYVSYRDIVSLKLRKNAIDKLGEYNKYRKELRHLK